MNSPKILLNLIKKTHVHQCYKLKVLRNAACSLHLSKKYSTQEHVVDELVVKEKIQITKPTVTKWKRPPFVKDFFFGRFDTELLAFPEILDNELIVEVEKYVKDLNKLYAQKVNSIQIDETGKIPGDILEDLKSLGLFGRMMPQKYGGLDLSYTACTRLNEVIGLDWSIYSLLTAHEFLASRVILLFGSEEQKNKYLPLLASGKLIAAFCAAEFESGCDMISTAATATLNTDGNYCINGTKCWVSNADIADVFIVFAKTPNPVDPEHDHMSVFIVDKNSNDIFINPLEKTCLRGLNTSIVNFKEVIVPKKNRIGGEGEGYTMYYKIMEGFKIAMNSFTFGTLKVLLDSVTERIINSERIEQSIGDFELVRQRLSRIACMIYAMESIAYFTSAILDSSENPDVQLESSILKIFNSEGTLYCVRELMNVIGSTSLMKETQLERFHRDGLGLQMFDGPNDVAKLFIGLMGCKIVGEKKSDDIIKGRNRFFFPVNTIKLEIRKFRLFTRKVKYDQDLAGHIHPSLTMWGNSLEEKLQKFQVAVEEVLTDHGKKVLQTQIDPKKLAEAAVYLYAMSAVLSRASRSYCIGLKNSTHEVELAEAFCLDADQMIYKALNDIFIGIFKNNEGTHLSVGEQVIDCRGYFPEHPLKHNF